jgi:hypothetical protein
MVSYKGQFQNPKRMQPHQQAVKMGAAKRIVEQIVCAR